MNYKWLKFFACIFIVFLWFSAGFAANYCPNGSSCSACPATDLTDKDGNTVLADVTSGGTSPYDCYVNTSVNFKDDTGTHVLSQNCHFNGFSLEITGVNAFSFRIGAAGNFGIDWGDGQTENIQKTNTSSVTYSHTYSTSGNYTVTITGRATSYSDETYITAISFYNSTTKTKITKIAGDLGELFPILNESSTGKPRFFSTFNGCTGLTSIPSGLFSGIRGAPTEYMFSDTFGGCSGLIGPIPSGLFGNLSGAPAEYMFYKTFYNCAGLTSIPPGLFSGINGAPAKNMFESTFYGCRGLTGSIPSGLFSGINGAPAQSMFSKTFSHCTELTSIGSGLFGNISGAPASSMFQETFYGCTGLTGPSATTSDGTPLYLKFPTSPAISVAQCYTDDTKLSDYSSIPDQWKEP